MSADPPPGSPADRAARPAPRSIEVGLNAVVVAVTRDEPRVLTAPGATISGNADSLPFGPLDPERDRTLELALRGWVREQTGLEVGYVEQLYTFGDKHRDPRERSGGPRVISIGYLSLVREDAAPDGSGARWRDWYDYLPWEDWRDGRPAVLGTELAPALDRWVAEAGSAAGERLRRERVDIAFGLGGAPWDPYRVLDRYELLYEASLVAESPRDRGEPLVVGERGHGREMRLDHRRILATAIQRLRGKIKYRPVVFELLPPELTLLQLQRVVEAQAGQRLHKQNFRRLVEKGGLVEGTGKRVSATQGRPAELFRFRREVLRERPTPGVGLPGVRPSS
ncbi:MAG: hypothetical protein MI919_02050 [Holophagales bacterium]|nr:hypothetical protein [Holophagales bacterium]